MDSVLLSRHSLDYDEDFHQEEVESLSSDRVTSRRSLDRYVSDIEQDLYSVQSREEESCNNPRALEELKFQLRSNSSGFSRLELDDKIEGLAELLDAMKANKTVREVEVHIEALEDLSTKEQVDLAETICELPDLRSLLIYKNSSVFLQPLARRKPFLVSHLRFCKLDISKAENICHLSSALQELSNLESLDIEFEANTADEVVQALHQLSHECRFESLAHFRIAHKLCQKTSTELNLDDRVVSAVADLAGPSRTLRSLSLPPFACSEQCHQILIQMLQQNCILEEIDYWVRVCSLYYPDTNETIDHLLHLNQSGVRSLVKKHSRISASDIWDLVMAHRHDVEIMYHLFSSDPSLLLTERKTA